MSRFSLRELARIGVLTLSLLLVGGYVVYRVYMPPDVIGGTKSTFSFVGPAYPPGGSPPTSADRPDAPR